MCRYVPARAHLWHEGEAAAGVILDSKAAAEAACLQRGEALKAGKGMGAQATAALTCQGVEPAQPRNHPREALLNSLSQCEFYDVSASFTALHKF